MTYLIDGIRSKYYGYSMDWFDEAMVEIDDAFDAGTIDFGEYQRQLKQLQLEWAENVGDIEHD